MEAKRALVTGATGGIGYEICDKLTQNGFYVYVNGRNEEAVGQLADKFLNEHKLAEKFVCDINDASELKRKLEAIPKLEVLINNAGVLRDNLIYNMSLEDWDLVVNTNYYSVLQLYEMLDGILSDNAIIINLCSISGITPRAGQCAYAVSKAMLIDWTKNMAKLRNNRKFYAISPGPVNTELIKKTKWYKQPNAVNRIPLKRYCEPGEITDFILMIMENSNAFISGSNFIIDGGFIQTVRD